MSKKIAHKLVAKTAHEIACEVYEVLAGANNDFFKAFPTIESFVYFHWKEFIGDARKALTQMLIPQEDGTFKYSEHMRNEVFEALCLEGEMRGRPQQTRH